MTVRWIAACAVGFAVALVVSAAAWLFSPVAPAVSAVAFGACALPPGLAFGWLLCVAPTNSAFRADSDGDVETHWITEALSGTATDLVVVMGLGLVAVSITRADIPTVMLLTALILLAFASCTTRYAVQRHRALSA